MGLRWHNPRHVLVLLVTFLVLGYTPVALACPDAGMDSPVHSCCDGMGGMRNPGMRHSPTPPLHSSALSKCSLTCELHAAWAHSLPGARASPPQVRGGHAVLASAVPWSVPAMVVHRLPPARGPPDGITATGMGRRVYLATRRLRI